MAENESRNESKNENEEFKPTTKPPTTLLIGPPGAGKTWSLATYAKAGLKLAVLFTDPGGEESFLSALEHYNIPLDNVHWAYIPPMDPSWKDIIDVSTKVTKMSYQMLAKLSSPAKSESQLLKLVEQLANFKCQHCGEELGPIDSLNHEWAFCLDSLSGLNTIAMEAVVGLNPHIAQGEYGVAMNVEEQLIQKIVSSTKCFVGVVGHVERTIDELTGLRQVMVALIGKKLASTGKIARLFSDIVYAKKSGADFYWSTAEKDVDLKNRLLPASTELPPTFETIVERWRELNLKAAGKGKEE